MTSKAFGLAQLGNAFNDGALSNRNKIINGAMQVSQRGDYTSATSLTGTSTYYLDRFKARAVGVTATFEQNVNQTLDNNDVVNTFRMDVTSTATGRVEVTQIIEDFNWFKNKTVTFSARVKSNSTNARLVFNADGGGGTTASSAHTGGGGWELLTGTATLTSGVTGVQLYAGIQAAGTGDVAGVTSGDYFEVSEVQLEAGDTATPFEHRSYGQELALCQRYCRVDDMSGAGFGNLIPAGTNEFLFVKSIQDMRSAPTCTFPDGLPSNLQRGGVTLVGSTVDNISTVNSINLLFRSLSSQTIGTYYGDPAVGARRIVSSSEL